MSSNHISFSCWWEFINQARDQFWWRWQREHLSTLSLRRKRLHQKQNPKESQLFLLKEPAPYTNRWRLTRIERMHPGSDNMVRVTTVQTSEVLVKRPLHQLAALPDVVDGAVAKANNKYRQEQWKMSRDQRDPWIILLTPLIFVEILLYKCYNLIFQGNVRLRLGTACCWTENDQENREQWGILKLVYEARNFISLHLFFKILVVPLE